MAVTETTTKVQVKMMLEDGQTSSGAVKTVGVNLGTLKVATYDNQKAVNIVNALSPMFSKSLYFTQKTGTFELEES